ncbi:MAG: AraC family transcriptional regulator [Cellulosilyticaceae bacterium]
MHEQKFYKKYLQELYVNLQRATITQCSPQWEGHDYTPTFSSIGLICEGEGWIKVNDTLMWPRVDQMYLLPAHTQQSYATDVVHSYTKYYCHFDVKCSDMNLFDLIKLPLCITLTDSKEAKRLFEQMITCLESGVIQDALRANLLMLELLIYYIEHCPEDSAQWVYKQLNTPLSSALDYIHENLDQPISVEKLGEITGYNPRYFTKLFKDTLGTSPIQYINKRKIEKATHLLTSTGISIAEVAEATGFNNQFYFCNLFKKHTGLSPTDYRNAYETSYKAT